LRYEALELWEDIIVADFHITLSCFFKTLGDFEE